MSMFENRALTVRMTKTPQDGIASNDPRRRIDPEEINNLIKDQVTHTVLIVGGAILAKKILDTVCEIALIASKEQLQ